MQCVIYYKWIISHIMDIHGHSICFNSTSPWDQVPACSGTDEVSASSNDPWTCDKFGGDSEECVKHFQKHETGGENHRKPWENNQKNIATTRKTIGKPAEIPHNPIIWVKSA